MNRKKRKVLSFTIFFTLFLLNNINAQKYTRYSYVTEVNNESISYNLFEYRHISSHTIDATNLDIDKAYHSNIKKINFPPETNIKVDLLSKGYAKLININKASDVEINAENLAKQNNVGRWKKRILIDTTNLDIGEQYLDYIKENNDSLLKINYREHLLSKGYAKLIDTN